MFLTSRAGEDIAIEGLLAGADDYLTMPFFAREIVARVGAVIERARSAVALRESETRFRAFVTASSDVVYRMSPDWSEMRALEGQGYLSDATEPRANWMNGCIHRADQPAVRAAIRRALATRTIFELEHRVQRLDDGL